MKKSTKYFTLLLIALFAFSISSCREKTTGEKIEDSVEEVGDELEESADDIKDEVEEATDGN